MAGRVIFATIVAASVAIGCGGANKGLNDGRDAAMRTISPVACDADAGRVVHVDLNGDNTADVIKVYAETDDGEVLVCREADLNFDGTKELIVFFDESGAIARDEVDLGYDGTVDIISSYVAGQVIKQEVDTNGDGIVDRVRFFEKGIPTRTEGDLDQDGRIDYWEYFEGGKLIRIGLDMDGDGRVDRWMRDSKAAREAEKKQSAEEETAPKEGESQDAQAKGDKKTEPEGKPSKDSKK